MAVCSIKGCGSSFRMRKGFCNKHFLRWYRHGDPLTPSHRDARPAVIEGDIAKIPLGTAAKGGYAVVDKEFAHLAKHKWVLDHGYARTEIKDKRVYMQHVVIGKPPKGKVTDHKDRDKLNNRRSNLVHTTQRINSFNTKMRSHNTSGHTGVLWDRARGKWRVAIGKKHVGRFDDFKEAVKARLESEITHYGRLKEEHG